MKSVKNFRKIVDIYTTYYSDFKPVRSILGDHPQSFTERNTNIIFQPSFFRNLCSWFAGLESTYAPYLKCRLVLFLRLFHPSKQGPNFNQNSVIWVPGLYIYTVIYTRYAIIHRLYYICIDESIYINLFNHFPDS